jgi:hypothetical protein
MLSQKMICFVPSGVMAVDTGSYDLAVALEIV